MTQKFASDARLEEIRLFLTYVSNMNFKVFQMDVETAFLHGDLKKEVFLKHPPGFETIEFHDHVYRLYKSIY